MKLSTIYYNGNIITLDRKNTVAEAFGVFEDLFTDVGTSDALLNSAPADAVKVNLHGKTVIPGLNEGHCHPRMGITAEAVCDIPSPPNIPALLEWISEKAHKSKPGEWIILQRFFPTRIKEMRMPTRAELDSVSPRNPVFLDGAFAGVVNTQALQISGIRRESIHPGVLKDAHTHEPTGVLHKSAVFLLKNIPVPNFSDAELEVLYIKMLHLYNSVGFTSYTDALLPVSEMEFIMRLGREGKLTARAYLHHCPTMGNISAPELETHLRGLKYKTGDGDAKVKVGQFKVFVDGGTLTGTAFMRQPWGSRTREIYQYSDPQFCGNVNFSQKELNEVVETAYNSGWTFTAHVTGDAAADRLLTAYESLHAKHDISSMRYNLLHGNFLHADSLEKCKRMNITLDIQPIWLYKDYEALREMLGGDRLDCFHNYRTILDAGLVMCGGSDHMVGISPNEAINPYNPFWGMYALCEHCTQKGTVVNTLERLSRIEALRVYTINGAYKSFEENIKGSIEPGRLADFVILPKDIITCTAEELLSMTVNETFVGGSSVYKAHTDKP